MFALLGLSLLRSGLAQAQGQDVYVTNHGLGSGVVIGLDETTSAVVDDPTSVESGPYGVTVNPATNRIHVLSNAGNSISVISGATYTVIATGALPNGAHPRGAAVSGNTNGTYGATPRVGVVRVINGATNELIATIETFSAPESAAVDVANTRVYAKAYVDEEVEVSDEGSNDVLSGAFVTDGRND